MSDNVLSIWKSRSEKSFSAVILPDGCRDVIFKVVGNQKPLWSISPLFDTATQINVKSNSELIGFRMRPGVAFNEKELTRYLAGKDIAHCDMQSVLNDFTYLDCSIAEGLHCLASENISSIQQAAAILGVSSRSLQRLFANKTGRSPSYWFQLARIRKAGIQLNSLENLSSIADICGFSDQSHMTREFQRWFQTTPQKMLKNSDLIEQLYNKGYA